MLPFFGDTLSFVLFHDMGNVFTNAGDAWASALRIQQPDRDRCKVLTTPTPQPALNLRSAPGADNLNGTRRANAASTTSRMRQDWACATIPRLGPSGSTSATT